MASPTVVAALEAAIASALPAFEVQSAYNEFGDAQSFPATWAAVLDGPAKEERIALGASGVTHRESGTALVALFVAAGTGVVALFVAAETLRNALRNLATGGLRVLAVDPAQLMDRGDGLFFGATVAVDYTLDY